MKEESQEVKYARREWHEALGALTAINQIIKSAPELVTDKMYEVLRQRELEEQKTKELLSALIFSCGTALIAWQEKWNINDKSNRETDE